MNFKDPITSTPESQSQQNFELLQLYSTPESASINLFAGIPSLQLSRARTGRITLKDQQRLLSVGIPVSTGEYRVSGLVHIRNVDTHFLDLASIKELLEKCLEELHHAQSPKFFLFQEVQAELEELVTKLSYSLLTSNCEEIQSLVAKRNEALACIGSLCLPAGLMTELEDPITFTDRTLPLLGKYILSQI